MTANPTKTQPRINPVASSAMNTVEFFMGRSICRTGGKVYLCLLFYLFHRTTQAKNSNRQKVLIYDD
jgi:hypothetical protein